MATNDRTTLVCLFHHREQANAAVQDLLQAGLPEESVSLLGGPSSNQTEVSSSFGTLGIPQRDQQHLLDGVAAGGVLVAVQAIEDNVGKAEDVFGKHRAEKIDEMAQEIAPAAPASLAAVPTDGATAIPIVEEELAVGKRTVDRGGIRLYRRVVDVPVDAAVELREEHVHVDRHTVNRPVTDADLAFAGDRTITLKETAEEAVVGKTAHVVEELVVGKTASEHIEHIQDTVRKTEVEVEQIAPTLDPLVKQTKL